MSLTRVIEVTLEELIKRSTHIVIVAPDSPPSETEIIPIMKEGKEYPPYHRLVYHYRVLESLRGDLKKASKIQVVSAHDAQNEHVYRLSVTENTNKSVFEQTYRPQAAYQVHEPHILFLTKHAKGKRYAFVTGGSAEGLGMRNEIERKLKPVSTTSPGTD